MSATAVIEAEDITVAFGDYTVFKNVSFSIYEGEIVVILGGSGCGKSTLLKVLCGLLTPTSGKVSLFGEDFTSATSKARDNLRRRFGIMFQSGGLFGSMTLAENVALPLQEFTQLAPSEIADIVHLKLSALGLGNFAGYLPAEISGGMKKRAGLARAMALDPALLFFDEPSAGLDPISSASLDNLIKSINSSLGTTMVVVTHELDSIFSIAHRVIMLDREAKGIIATGNPRELQKNSTNPKVYNFFNRIG